MAVGAQQAMGIIIKMDTDAFPPIGLPYVSQNGASHSSGSWDTEIVAMSLTGSAGSPTISPPDPGSPPEEFESFFDVFVDIDMRGADSFFDVFVGVDTDVPTRLRMNHLSTSSDGRTGTFDTEIIAMSLVGSMSGGPDVVINVLPSSGRTSITDLGGGQWQIDSFFDVFTEISVDGGAFVPSTAPMRMVLEPEPATLGLLLIGGCLALMRRR